MNQLIKLEEFGEFILTIFLFSQLEYAWWVYPACLLLPDFSMLGYVVDNRIGAWTYNFFHHKALGIAAFMLGFGFGISWLTLAGVILFGHAAMDRMFGYGLKFKDDFKHTHLGWIGKKEVVQKTY